MIPALWICKTGLDSQQTNISVTSNNLANASTVGYKKSRAIFEDLLYQKVNQPGGRSTADSFLPEGLMVGAGSRVVATQKNFAQGDVETTDNTLDLLIKGDGFFEIEMQMAPLLIPEMVSLPVMKKVPQLLLRAIPYYLKSPSQKMQLVLAFLLMVRFQYKQLVRPKLKTLVRSL